MEAKQKHGFRFFYVTFCNLNTDAIKLLKVLGFAIRAIFQSSCAVA